MSDTAMPWKDGKRHLWALAPLTALIPLVALGLYDSFGAVWMLWIPFLFFYGLTPIVETLYGEDPTNPPREAIPFLRDDRYYRWTAFAVVPLVYLVWIVSAWYVGSHTLHWSAYLAITISAGMTCAGALNTGHELGHRRDPVSLFMARLLLAMSGMGHFRIEHNFGHHVQVATPEDSATAAMGENFYEFVLHELPGGFRRAWAIETARLARKGKSAFSFENELVQNTALTLGLYGLLALAFGIGVLPYLFGTALWANLMLSSANYIEHYGLMRAKRDDGRYERVQPHHSWNSNHIVSNVMLLHLQRHSDHHAHAERPYQCLRHFDTSPQLPAGYFTMYLAAWLPPVWFRVMDRRLAAQVGHDMTRAYIKPSFRDTAFRRWHRPAGETGDAGAVAPAG